MKKKLLPLVAAAGLLPMASQGALIFHYTFDTINGTTVANSGTSGTDGTLSGTGAGAGGYVAGPTGLGTAYDFTTGGADDNKVSAVVTPTSLGIDGDNNYTMAAWVQMNSVSERDSMVFSATPDNNDAKLHNGVRDLRPHQGHWGNDTTAAGTITADNSTWHHLTWTYDGTANTQEIFVDGVSVANGINKNGIGGAGQELAVGWTGRDSDDAFNGVIDDARIYDTVLSQAEITALATLVPEPSVFGLVGIAGLLTIIRRRR